MTQQQATEPLASRLRPAELERFVGQAHILGAGQPLRQSIDSGQLHSMLFWGPPGVGKTTLAHLIADKSNAALEKVSAVMAGVKDIRLAVERAQQRRQINDQDTILFVDEVHRFNKSQQDAFLPFVEDGTVVFIGATTENPSFELNNALLSRCRLYILKPLAESDIAAVIENALEELDAADRVLPEHRQMLAASVDGDARRAINLLELLLQLIPVGEASTADALQMVLQESWKRFDKGGDQFYEQISALHKAVRGSSPDAALYWYARMLHGGCDPLYIARRVVRMASEDIGNADPRALQIALDAWQTYERLGSPEGELTIAQALVYMAVAAKSNATYVAYKAALRDARDAPAYDVPVHLRNAPTELHKTLGYGDEYRYAHDEADGFSAGESYFPEELKDSEYYAPVARGLEDKIRQRLEHYKQLNAASNNKRYGN